MKPVLLARIALLSTIALSIIVDGTSLLGFFITLTAQIALVYAFFLFGKSYNKSSIFSNYLIGFISSITSSILLIFSVKEGGSYLLKKFGNSNETDLTAFLEDLTKRATSDPEFASEVLKSLLMPQFITYGLVIIIAVITSMVFAGFAYKNLGKAAGVKNLVLSGNLFVIGGLTFIIGIGALITIVAFVLLIVSVFQLDENLVAEGRNHENPMQ